MGGLDKGLQVHGNKMLVEQVINRLRPQLDQMLIVANRNIAQYQQFGFSVISDHENTADYQGPMAGISAALRWITEHQPETNAVLISSCDTPFLPPDLVQRLIDSSNANDVCVAHDGQRRQNLHCLIKQRAWPSLLNDFKHGERALWRWQDHQELVEVDFSDQARAFQNLNAISDLSSRAPD